MLHERIHAQVPLAVDLDGTLVRGDVALEALVGALKRGPRVWWALFLALLGGRAALKACLARIAPVDPASLAYRPEVLALIAQARAEGRPVLLATAAHWRNAARVARHLGCFDGVLASRRGHNLKGRAKLAALEACAAPEGFDYVGDTGADRPIWARARVAYTVAARTHAAGEQRIARQRGKLMALVKAARPHQWAKNALVFVPLASSGLLLQPMAVGRALIAFACLSLIASSIYLVNDLLDVEADRLHPKKSKRPIAAGELPIPLAVLAAVAGVVLGLGSAALLLAPAAVLALSGYLVLTVSYSFRLKAAMVADVLALACLYTIRIVAGAAAIAVGVSSWLLLFSIFFFLSLGYLKRFIELATSQRAPDQLLSGRGYIGDDKQVVAMTGVAAGLVSILVLVQFAEAMRHLPGYLAPQLLWLMPLPLLYWINRIWLMAWRGEVDSDPVAFALTDRRSIVTLGSMGVLFLAAKFVVLPAWLAALL
ncbi:MAG: UbiA family prenyltransferase [Proteobacteria bacterium]|nr:UbiA family prenyltransferase [Pseudomonadota bacterium]